MAKTRVKILRYDDIDVAAAFAKESELLDAIKNGQLDQALLLWQSCGRTLVLPAGNKWPQSASLTAALNQFEWQVFARKTCGAPVPQTQGVINVSYLYALPDGKDYSIPAAYRSFCHILSKFFNQFGVAVQSHTSPGSYCDGDYNLNKTTTTQHLII